MVIRIVRVIASYVNRCYKDCLGYQDYYGQYGYYDWFGYWDKYDYVSY